MVEKTKILGCNINIDLEEDISLAKTIINRVEETILGIKKVRPGLNDTEIAVLAALNIAQQKELLAREFDNHLNDLEKHLQNSLTHLNQIEFPL